MNRYRRFGAITIALAMMVGASLAYAHNKQLAKDGCHRMAGELHHHAAGASVPLGPCERKGKITIKTIVEKQFVEVAVAQPTKIITKEIKHVRVQKFEAAMGAILDRLESVIAAEANRPPRVVERTYRGACHGQLASLG